MDQSAPRAAPDIVPAAPDTAPKGRIEQLDVLRGIAILGILLINLPPAATTLLAAFAFPHLAGWTPTDQASWYFLQMFVEGTQRGLLQFLFGASMLILTARAMTDEGPVRVADLYFRRNLWLLLFGLINIFVLLFPGDILFIYALAALFLFPFRRLGPKTLLAIGLSWTLITAAIGAYEYAERAELVDQMAMIEAGGEPFEDEAQVLTDWDEVQAELSPDADFLAWDEAGRRGTLREYAHVMHEFWLQRARDLEIFFHAVPEAFATMLIGASLFKWGVLQGLRRRRFYLVTGAIAYVLGLGLRAVELEQQLAYGAGPRLDWITGELARLATTFGHVALVSLILSLPVARWLMVPFGAAGRVAFSLYVMQTILIMWVLFPAIGFSLFGTLGWAQMLALALAIGAAQLLLAHLWLRLFAAGPLEWLWRSLVQWKAQPFRRTRA